MTKEKSKISFSYLRNFNLVMGFLHLIQGSLMLWLGLTLDNIKDFSLPITTSFLKYDEVLETLILQKETIAELPIAAIVSSFLFLSAIAHFVIVIYNKKYNSDLQDGVNQFRWFEYALSSSIMIALIAMFFGVYDLSSLILIIGINATMNLFGLMMELYNKGSQKKEVNWAPFIMGSFAGLVPWVVIVIHFLGSGEFDQIPWFVYAVLISYFVFFNLFPINMYLQYRRIGKWKDYLYGERAYILLSLFAKSILAWLVFFGTLQP
jgi:hypothetical protein